MAKVVLTFTVDDRDEADFMERLQSDVIDTQHPWIPGAHFKKVQAVELVGDDRATGRTYVRP